MKIGPYLVAFSLNNLQQPIRTLIHWSDFWENFDAKLQITATDTILIQSLWNFHRIFLTCTVDLWRPNLILCMTQYIMVWEPTNKLEILGTCSYEVTARQLRPIQMLQMAKSTHWDSNRWFDSDRATLEETNVHKSQVLKMSKILNIFGSGLPWVEPKAKFMGWFGRCWLPVPPEVQIPSISLPKVRKIRGVHKIMARAKMWNFTLLLLHWLLFMKF